jgi:predicted N-acetyltransferase YhbS
VISAVEIEILNSHSLDSSTRGEILSLCRDAYGEEMEGYLVDVGPGVHLLGRIGGTLVTHAMFVERRLQISGGQLLRTAYVELVATRVSNQRRGHASRLLRRRPDEVRAFDIGALSPSDETFYSRLGWETWCGDLFVRTDTGIVPSPGEQLMVLRLARTPPTLSPDGPVSIEWRPGEIW